MFKIEAESKKAFLEFLVMIKLVPSVSRNWECLIGKFYYIPKGATVCCKVGAFIFALAQFLLKLTTVDHQYCIVVDMEKNKIRLLKANRRELF
jgi:hypothetical protein